MAAIAAISHYIVLGINFNAPATMYLPHPSPR